MDRFKICAATLLFAAPVWAQPASVKDDFLSGRYQQGIADFKELRVGSGSLAEASFWAAQCYFRRHQFQDAAPLLKVACEGDLPEPQRDKALELRERVQKCQELCPPLLGHPAGSGLHATVFARKSAWSDSLVLQFPTFFSRAREVFGPGVPEIAFYLFEDRLAYDVFCANLLNPKVTTGHRGTGGTNFALFCEFYPNGRKIGAENPDDLFGRVLHEYGHAICNTVFGDDYLDRVPQWLNEGLADYLASIYLKDLHATAVRNLHTAARQRQPPSYEELSRKLYSDSSTGYALGDLMVEEIMRNRSPRDVGRIVEAARRSDFETAIRQVTGADPRDVLQRVLKENWN